MKLIGLELGRVIILFSPEEIRPSQGIPIAKAVVAIRERYRFTTGPDLSLPIAQVEKDGYRFEAGAFECDGQEVAIRDLGIYNDGISVTAYDTVYAEAFLDDFLNWAVATLGLRAFDKVPRRLYRSQLIAEFDKPLSNSFKNFAAIGRALAAGMDREPVDVVRIDFGVDPNLLTGTFKPGPFVLERRANYPYSDERYFCEAPLATAKHIEVLRNLESNL